MHRVKRVRYGGSIHLAKPPEEEEEKEDPLRLKQKSSKVSAPSSSSFGPAMAADSLKRVAIALGSNLGDRPGNLREALRRLGALPHVSVQATSRLYESSPMYVTDQPAFLNAAAEIRTTLPPLDLLRVLKDVERDMGRGFGGDQIRWGPRPIDLDIVFYEDETVMHAETDTTRELVVPHPRWQERDFVKGPLSDLTGSWALTASAVVSPTGLDRNLVASKRLWMEQGGERGLRMASKDGTKLQKRCG